MGEPSWCLTARIMLQVTAGPAEERAAVAYVAVREHAVHPSHSGQSGGPGPTGAAEVHAASTRKKIAVRAARLV